ncbi:hypothetical protein CR513_00146, partial [Mucuna pruriens]
MIARVLIDNGSSLNVLPKATLDKLASIDAQLKASPVVVRAFDGSKREVMGEISLPILIGPALFNINFQVMDIRPAYSCLLRRPWIHAAGAVPSSLHQQVKFINNHQIISIIGEKELVITTPAPEEYIEGDEEVLEASFQSLEVEDTKGGKPKDTASPLPTNMALILAKQGVGSSPGRHISPNPGTRESRTSQTRLSRKRLKGSRLGAVGSVSAIGDETKGQAGWVYATRKKLTNWAAEGLPDQDFLEIKNNPISPIDNQSLGNEEPDQPNTPTESVSTEAEALVDIERWTDREKPKFEAPTKDLESVSLREGTEGREVRIGKQLPRDSRAKLIKLLKEYVDVFAWSYQDMPGLD